jgi:hypothetical protein
MYDEFSAENKEPSPTHVQYVVSHEAAAMPVMSGGDRLGDTKADRAMDVPVVAMAGSGKFIGVGASVPSGAKAPTGTVLVLTVTADKGQLTDWGISNVYPPMSKLGRVQPL